MKNNISFNRSVMTLSDLRRLGCQGGAVLILEDGRQAQIRPRYASMQSGQLNSQENILSFHVIYSAITAVKRKHLVVAERIKRNGKNQLVLTGIGYHRPI
ncbi:hypothetical protein V2S78_05250 [Streptococcus agalactiae]|nr:hypothetical protein [Streptococcus halichoeri]